MAGLGLSGIASGVDTSAIVEALMGIERQALTRNAWRQKAIQTQQSGLRDVRTKLVALQSAARDLALSSNWESSQAVGTSDSTKLAATRRADATPGTYDVEVQALATYDKEVYGFTSPPTGDSSVTINGRTVNVPSGSTLAQLVTAINGTADIGVTAAVESGQLALTSTTVGTPGDMAVSSQDSTLTLDAARSVAATDASYRVDGGAWQAATSNTVSSAIAGLDLTLKAVTTAPVKVTVAEATEPAKTVKDKIKAFADAYNAVLGAVDSRTKERKVPTAATESDYVKGQLFGDSHLQRISSKLRIAMGGSVTGLAAELNELREIGVATSTANATISGDAKLGKLTIDDAKLTQALASDLEGVRKLFAGATAGTGMAQRVVDLVENDVSTRGIIAGRIEAGDSRIKRLVDQTARAEERIDAKEKRLRAQFAAMEKAMGLAQSQQQWLSGQIAGLYASG